jgi:hypothetical protein
MMIRGNENWVSGQSRARKSGDYLWPGVLGLRLDGWGKTLLFALACCLTIVASGCGSVAADPAKQSGGTGSSQVSPQLTVSATSLSFGNITVNTAGTQVLTLASSGSSPVTINSATVAGAGFTMVGQTFPVTLNPSQSLTVEVQFDPATAGVATGQITINSNSTTASTAVVGLNGTGTTTSGSQTGPQVAIGAASLSFGSVTVNTAVVQSLTLTSTGTSPVTISSGAITGAGFTIVAQTSPVTLNPGQSLTLQVQFDPTAAGAVTGQLTISSNSTTGNMALVALSGTGTASSSPQSNPQVTIGAASLNFGSVTANTATTQTLMLTSTGTSPVTINSASISGADFTTVGGSFPVTLNPGQALTVQVQFYPTTAGVATGQLTINSNSTTGSTATVALSGTGAAAAHQVALNWIAPVSSPDPVAGYNVYRATGSGAFVRISSSPDLTVGYTDTGVTSGTAYSYQVTSVDLSGVESVPSNQVTVTVP